MLTLVGSVTLTLVATDRYLVFLTPGMLVPLAATGTLLVLLGGLTLWPAVVAYVDGEGDVAAHGAGAHDAGAHLGSIGWLLLLPLTALALVAPTPLGADAARRDIGRSVPPPAEPGFGPLPAPTRGRRAARETALSPAPATTATTRSPVSRSA